MRQSIRPLAIVPCSRLYDDGVKSPRHNTVAAAARGSIRLRHRRKRYNAGGHLFSDPLGAAVYVDGTNVGITPGAANLARNASHSIRIEKPGYLPYETTTVLVESGWSAANPGWLPLLFPFGNIVAFWVEPVVESAADSKLGGMYDIRPTDISAQLIPGVGNPIASTAPVSEAVHTTPSDANQSAVAKDDSQAATSSKADP